MDHMDRSVSRRIQDQGEARVLRRVQTRSWKPRRDQMSHFLVFFHFISCRPSLPLPVPLFHSAVSLPDSYDLTLKFLCYQFKPHTGASVNDSSRLPGEGIRLAQPESSTSPHPFPSGPGNIYQHIPMSRQGEAGKILKGTARDRKQFQNYLHPIITLHGKRATFPHCHCCCSSPVTPSTGFLKITIISLFIFCFSYLRRYHLLLALSNES